MGKLNGYDLDGVFLSYGEHAVGDVRINHALIESLADAGVKELVIITNQGGMNFSTLMQPPKAYPTPRRVAARIMLAVDALEKQGIRVAGVYASTYHPFFEGTTTCRQTAEALLSYLAPALHGVDLVVSAQADTRKPWPHLLLWAGVGHFYGDDIEADGGAAKAACVPFTLLERFK